MDDIFILQSDIRARAALMGALSASQRVRVLENLSALVGHLRRSEPRACVLDIFDFPNSVTISDLRSLRRNHPSVALIVASDFSGREMDLYRLGRLNVDGVIRLEDQPSAREIHAAVDQSVAVSLANRVVGTAGALLPPLAQDAIRWAIENAEHRPPVSDLSAALAMSPRVLLRELRARDLVPPRAILLWGRLIRGIHLLERPSETVESVAYRLGYSSGGALGKALKRHVGCCPTLLLKKGGLQWTLEVFQGMGLRPRRP